MCVKLLKIKEEKNCVHFTLMVNFTSQSRFYNHIGSEPLGLPVVLWGAT